jgi:hypothetical protein
VTTFPRRKARSKSSATMCWFPLIRIRDFAPAFRCSSPG